MLANLLTQLGLKLMTQSFLAKVIVLSLYELSKMTTGSKLDDQLIAAIADALSVKLPD